MKAWPAIGCRAMKPAAADIRANADVFQLRTIGRSVSGITVAEKLAPDEF